MLKDYSIYHTADLANYNKIKDWSVENRKYPTEAEYCLWEFLRSKNVGHKFRRQHIIDDYIVDFVNLHTKLIIEVDGEYHLTEEQKELDKIREEKLTSLGFTTLRFSNEQVLQDTDNVKRIILQTMNKLDHTENQSNATPSLTGEGRGEASLAWAVDAACSGNPGPMEYRGVDLTTKEVVFHFGPIKGTNNIGEFLAIVHAMALMEQRGLKGYTIYTDSVSGQAWVRRMQCKTNLERNPETEKAWELVERAEKWLKTHSFRAPIVKWDTKEWGEIPADFGRK